jgi:uncharacterized membrane protein
MLVIEPDRDDLSAAAPLHHRIHGLAAREHRSQVDVDDGVPELHRVLFRPPARVRSGVRDEDVDAAEAFGNRAHDRRDGFAVSEVGGERVGVRAQLAELGDRGVRFGAVAPDDRDGRARFPEPARDSQADPAVTARHDGHFAAQIKNHDAGKSAQRVQAPCRFTPLLGLRAPKRVVDIPRIFRPRAQARRVRASFSGLWIGTIVAFVVLSALAAVRAADWSYGADTGTFVQIVLDAFGGMRNGVEGTTHFRYHWSPTLMLLWAFLAVTHSLWVLQTILAAATVACAPLLAAVARIGVDGKKLESAVADRIGIVALVYAPLVGVGFGEFRDLGLLPCLALGWWLAIQRRAWTWVAVCALLLVGLREDVCLEIAIIGCVVAITGERTRDRAKVTAGLGSAAAAVFSAAIYVFVVLPRVGPWPPSHFYDYPFAHGPLALLLSPFTHPLALAAAILIRERFTYVLESLAPLAFIPMRTRIFGLALPGFAIVLLANSGLVWRMGMHYAALWIPWLLIAFVAGIATLRLPLRWTTVVLALSAVQLIFFNPLHPQHYLRPSYHALGDARAALACVPPGATVATHDEWYTAVSARRPDAMVLGDDPPPADWLVVADDYPNKAFAQNVLPRVQDRVRRGEYRAACRHGSVVAYQRVQH